MRRTSGQMSRLRKQRLDRNWTLERTVQELDQREPKPTGITTARLSEWERGVRDPSMANRKRLCALYETTPAELFGDPLEGDRVRLVSSYADLHAAMVEVVRSAYDHLVVTGSRARQAPYLHEIEQVLEQRPALVHYRLLFGPPRRQTLRTHLLKLLDLRDPADRSQGTKTLHIGLIDDLLNEPERFFVASERLAVTILPSLTTARNFDTGVVLQHPRDAQRLIEHGKQLYAGARRLETRAAIQALEVLV